MKIPSKLFINIVCVVATFAAVSSCSSSDSNQAKSSPKTYTIEIKQMVFSPAQITVHKGDTIVFINNDMVDHNITEEDQHAWSSSPLHTGQSWSMPVTASANYFCSLHPVMKGQITVQ